MRLGVPPDACGPNQRVQAAPHAVAENHQVAKNFLSLMNYFDCAGRASSL
jgi:hypothetical protein